MADGKWKGNEQNKFHSNVINNGTKINDNFMINKFVMYLGATNFATNNEHFVIKWILTFF